MNNESVWDRIRAHAGETFHTKTGLPFTYEVPGNYRFGEPGEPLALKDQLRQGAECHARGWPRCPQGSSGIGVHVSHPHGSTYPPG